MADWKKNLFELSDTRILFYLQDKGVSRYSELLGHVVRNRSTLAAALTQLQNADLIARRVKDAKPVQTEYRLTDKGKDFVRLLVEIKGLLGIQ